MGICRVSVQRHVQVGQRGKVCIFKDMAFAQFKHFRFPGPFEKVFIYLKIVVSAEHLFYLFFSVGSFLTWLRICCIDFHHIQYVIGHCLKPLSHRITVESFELFLDEAGGDGDMSGELDICSLEIIVFHVEDEFVQQGNEIERCLVLYSFDKIPGWFFQQFGYLVEEIPVFIFIFE